MKKIINKITAMIMSAFLIINMSEKEIIAYDTPETIRVGIENGYKNLTSITISSTDVTIGYERDGNFIKSYDISSSTGFSISSGSGYFVNTGKSYSTFKEAMDDMQDYNGYGYTISPAILSTGKYGIYLCDINTYSEASIVASHVGGSVVGDSAKIISVKKNGVYIAVFDGINPQFTGLSSPSTISLGNRSYRGRMEIGMFSGTLLTAVNVIDIDDYLYSVLPSEIPITWEEESLKAQIVAARSYTVNRIGMHKESGYDLCDGSNCQVYTGFENENPITNALIDETEGIMAYYDGKPINASYFSSSGGFTDNSENVWVAEIPYLRAVNDSDEYDTTKWSRTYTLSDLEALMKVSGDNIGQVNDMVITRVSEYGRVQELHIIGSAGTKVLTKESIRTFFSPIGGSLPSRMFVINGEISMSKYDFSQNRSINVQGLTGTKTIESNDITVIGQRNNLLNISFAESIFAIGAEGNFVEINIGSSLQSDGYAAIADVSQGANTTNGIYVINGLGNGHGIGMSQKGARGLAKKGYTYEQILKHYFSGIIVK